MYLILSRYDINIRIIDIAFRVWFNIIFVFHCFSSYNIEMIKQIAHQGVIINVIDEHQSMHWLLNIMAFCSISLKNALYPIQYRYYNISQTHPSSSLSNSISCFQILNLTFNGISEDFDIKYWYLFIKYDIFHLDKLPCIHVLLFWDDFDTSDNSKPNIKGISNLTKL